MSFQTRESFVRPRDLISDIFDENWEACDCPIDCQVNYTVKAQKSIKKHRQNSPSDYSVRSVVQSEFYEATSILFVRKVNKNNYSTIRQQFVIFIFFAY